MHTIVEGQTEEGFVNRLLVPELSLHQIYPNAHRITTGRHHGRLFRGGLVNYEHLANDLVLWMKGDSSVDSWFTTMIDFYKLPINFPGIGSIPQNVDIYTVAKHLEEALRQDIAQRLDNAAVSRRFIPYVQMHEFEAVLFSDPSKFLGEFPDNTRAVATLTAVRGEFETPEHIDDSPQTAPSKRILSALPDYQKPVSGVIVAERIGLNAIRNECHHFNSWFTRLLSLARV